LRQLIVALERTTKKTAVPPIVACESVATQRPSSVEFVGPQRARHNMKFTWRISIKFDIMVYNESNRANLILVGQI
jgi:hypothetical protein